MATGRIRRTARRGMAAAVLAWVGMATATVLMAPSAAAAPSATVEIRNVTPPAASVDKGGTVTFVNKIPAQNKGGIKVLTITASATVYTDVAVTFFGQKRALQPNQSTSWTFDDAATPGTITYTYRIVPQAGLPSNVATQVVNTVAGSLPKLPAPVPYVVQTIAPDLPQLPSVNLPQLPQVEVPLPVEPPQPPTPPGPEDPDGPPAPQPAPAALPPTEGAPYQYDTQPSPGLTPAVRSAAAAFDPSRFATAGSSDEGSGGGAGGAGGAPGGYDGASVPVFGQLAGLSNPSLEDEGVEEASAATSGNAALPAAALAAVIALATVTAALVRTHQAHRSSPARHAAR